MVMRARSVFRAAMMPAVIAGGLLGGAAPAAALDQSVIGTEPEARSPWAVFRLGFSAYRSGDKEEAVEAYRYAADNGQIGARWKLARMYAEGDGVTRDDYEAFKFFQEIVQQEIEPGAPEESYISDALVALGTYSRDGIPNSPVDQNLLAAQEYYMRAAANYRHPVAQFEIGRMQLKGEGGMRANLQQAARWFQLSAEKGHVGAQATLGNLLFQSGQVVRGLAMMTAALERAPSGEREWIRAMHEEAFALAGETDRRTAIAMAQEIISDPR